MKNQHIETVERDPEPESFLPGWWVVAKKELAELWLGGRAMILMILFSVLLGIVSYLLATNSEMKILPPREMLFMTIQNTIAVGLFVGILIGADSISGERERATLEGLLLVPSSRRQIVVGKFLAAISPWPVALLLASAHLNVLAPTPEDFKLSILLAATLGSLLVLSFTGFGLLLSLWSESNRTSLFVGLFVSILFLIPTQFPGQAQAGIMGQTIKRINPMESVNQFVEKLVVNNRTFDEMSSWLISPVVFAVVVLVVLFWYAAPRLALDSRQARLPWPPRLKKASVVASLLIVLSMPFFMAAPASARGEDQPSSIQISIDKSYAEVKTGDSTEFKTVVQYNGSEESAPMVVAMNIVNLGEGEPVDPEDWSPERTQEVEPLAPGESAEQTWTITAILAGDYLAYMTVIPEPQEPGDTSAPVSSPGIHFTVEAFAPLNPSGVLPVAVGLPVALILIFALEKLLGPGRKKPSRLDRAAA